MGHKVHPIGFRQQINYSWDSRWYAAKRDYALFLQQDLAVRALLFGEVPAASLSKIIIERINNKVCVNIYSSKIGVIMGKRGAIIQKLQEKMKYILGNDVSLKFFEIKKVSLDAKNIAKNIAEQLEKRIHFRKAMKRVSQQVMRDGAKGVKIVCGGRLGGTAIARTEKCKEGRVPLHTLRADIDFSCATAKTTYGTCGVKVWIYRGDITKYEPGFSDKILC